MQDNNTTTQVPDVNLFFLGFLAQVQGNWSEKEINEFRNILKKKGFPLSDEDFLSGLENAKLRYYDGDIHLFICTGKHCNPKFQPDSSNKSYTSFKDQYSGKISMTKCQGHCEEAPTLTIRVGNESKLFIDWGEASKMKTVLDFLISAAKKGTLLLKS